MGSHAILKSAIYECWQYILIFGKSFKLFMIWPPLLGDSSNGDSYDCDEGDGDSDDDDDDGDDDGVYLKAVSCEFQNLQIIRIICKCEVMMWWCVYRLQKIEKL